MNIFDQYKLDNKVAVITGGAGLLGVKHAEVIIEAGGIPVLWDINDSLSTKTKEISKKYNAQCFDMKVDITDSGSISEAFNRLIKKFVHVDILINNAANNPSINDDSYLTGNRLESFSLQNWQKDIDVGLTGAFLCSQVIGSVMALKKNGVILNISSDLGIIAPDQRIYYDKKIKNDLEQPVKPVTYSVVKHGIIGLTKYLATYWATKNVRVNSISPGGVYTNQPKDFVDKLTQLIPLGRMASSDEYKAAVLFLISDASSYMTGANLIIDGGRTCW